MKFCGICKCELNEFGNPASRDCGGDCLQCMAEVAEDPDCIKALQRIKQSAALDELVRIGREMGEYD